MSNGLMLGGEMDSGLMEGGQMHARREAREIVRFYMRTVQDKTATEQAGCPKHKSVEYVEIRIPGDNRQVVDRPVRDSDKAQYRDAYMRFQAGEKEQVVGTALEDWPPIAKHVVEDLRALRIRTVEQLAAVSDGQLHALGMGGRALRDQAKAYLELAAGGAPISRLTAELEDLRKELAAEKARNEEFRKERERERAGKVK